MTQSLNTKDLALVGAGYWGRNLARNFNALGVLHTLCDRSPETLQAYGPEYKGVRRCTNFEDVLLDSVVTKIAIAAPAALHYPLAKAALMAGKDVFVEKPLCLELADAEDLVAIAMQRQRILMVGHLLQYHPCVERLRGMVASGELGRLQYITSNRLNLGKIRQEENALWSFAPHDISVILSLAGGRLPERVRCTGGSYLNQGVADTTLTALRFGDGLRAHVFVSWLNPFKEQKLTVVGSKGMVVFDDTKPWSEKLSFHRDYLTWSDGHTPTASKAQAEFVAVEESEPLGRECVHFLDCCRSRMSPRTDGREGVQVLRLLKTAQASLDQDGEAADPRPASPKEYFAHSTAFVSPEAKVGVGSKIWHFCHVMPGAELGRNCNLGQNVVISPGVKLGENVKVQNNVSIYSGAVIEDDVFLGPSCVLTNVSNPRSQVNRRGLYETTIIRRGATIGANATIICGTTLGRYCFVAAGAVVTRDVPDYALMVGTPARQRGWMSRHGHPLRARDQDGHWLCPESGFRYAEDTAAGLLRCLDLDENEALPARHSVGTKSFRECRPDRA